MLTRFLRASLPAILAGTLGVQLAHADIFTWTDASGTINVSNLPPPDGVDVTKITHETPPSPAREQAAQSATHQAEVQALEARVGQLEYELEMAAHQAPPPVVYPVLPSPPMARYVADYAPPIAQYADYAPTSGCDWYWSDCGGSGWGAWGPGYYPGVVVLGYPYYRNPHRMHGGGDHPGMHPPMPTPYHPRRG